MNQPPPRQILTLQIVAAIAWAVLAQWPWTYIVHVAIAQAVLHAIAPFWFHLVVRIRPVHRACLLGPVLLAIVDAAFLLFAWRDDLWRDLTAVFVPVLGVAALVALNYGLIVMVVLGRRRARRQRVQ